MHSSASTSFLTPFDAQLLKLPQKLEKQPLLENLCSPFPLPKKRVTAFLCVFRFTANTENMHQLTKKKKRRYGAMWFLLFTSPIS